MFTLALRSAVARDPARRSGGAARGAGARQAADRRLLLGRQCGPRSGATPASCMPRGGQRGGASSAEPTTYPPRSASMGSHALAVVLGVGALAPFGALR